MTLGVYAIAFAAYYLARAKLRALRIRRATLTTLVLATMLTGGILVGKVLTGARASSAAITPSTVAETRTIVQTVDGKTITESVVRQELRYRTRVVRVRRLVRLPGSKKLVVRTVKMPVEIPVVRYRTRIVKLHGRTVTVRQPVISTITSTATQTLTSVETATSTVEHVRTQVVDGPPGPTVTVTRTSPPDTVTVAGPSSTVTVPVTQTVTVTQPASPPSTSGP